MNFELDVATWRCSGNSKNQWNTGETQLLNDEGFMCCLGQMSCQLGAKKEELLNLFTPEEYCFDEENVFSNSDGDTSLSLRAMDINDDMKTTPNEKIIKLQELFWKYDHTITTLNRHLI